jgi:NAD(P)-dependent dehydrogenase (short-subunit alcohol dehydrogenase family)
MKADAFRDQVVIVTGASSGIGRALALQLAGQGAKVALAARRAGLLEDVVVTCRQIGGEALAVPTDIADEAQCKAMVEKTVEVFGRLDMLANNAGLAVIARLEDYSDLGLFRHTMDVNFYGTVYCTYYALPHLIRSHGRIVAVSSLGGKAPLPYNSPYIASKFAMHGFFDSLRIELIRHGVSVTIVCPYWVVTGFHEAQMDKDGVPRGPRGRAIYSKNMMTAEHCADIIQRAAYRRQREVVMGPGRLIPWLKILAPGMLDRIIITFLKATVRRDQKTTS